MQTSNLNTTSQDTTNKFFSNYFDTDYSISSNQYDEIISYFETLTENKESAKLLAQSLINTAQKQRENPLLILQEFQKLPLGDINSILALYLNSTRVPTSYLGIQKTLSPSKFISRTVVW